MSTRQTTPTSSLVVLAPTNSLKRALSEDADSDSLPESKKIRLKSENTPQAKDRKKRRKKKKKTPVVGGSNGATALARRPSIDFGKGKRKAASAPPSSGHLEIAPGEGNNEDSFDGLVPDDSRGATETPADVEPLSATIVKLDKVQDAAGPSKASQAAESSSTALLKLTQELSAQASMLKKHESALSQLTQSLTCQICLDLLHKPYALAPCGHVSCYNCLVSWFTAARDPEEHFLGPRKKTCPHCRATIRERPVEVWTIKDMVAGLVKSGLGSGLSPGPPAALPLPGPPQPVDAAGPPDLWHNIFRYPHQHPAFHPPLLNGGEPPSVEDMGMLDQEDGGVYRCLDCMHEIWNGVCTNCQRVYQGHADYDGEDGEMFHDEDDDDSDVDHPFWPAIQPFVFGGPMGGPFAAHPFWHEDDDDSEDEGLVRGEDGYDSFIDDGDDHGGEEHAAAIIEIQDDSDSESEAPRAAAHARRAAPANRRVVSSDDEDDPRPSRRGRASTRVASPGDSGVIVVSDDESDAPRAYIPRGGARSRAHVVDLSIDEEEDYGSHEYGYLPF
ncbi:hypothetical protein C8R46DRAFT_668880 [Mycena filopes]|nr:hypothetical protein C8R46DRAFT_668880 [Mycena filopes]